MIKYLKERRRKREREITKKNIITYYKVSLVHFVHVLDLASNEKKRTISVSFYHVFFFKLVCSC